MAAKAVATVIGTSDSNIHSVSRTVSSFVLNALFFIVLISFLTVFLRIRSRMRFPV